MQTEYTILSIAQDTDIKHCPQNTLYIKNTLYYGLQTEYTILNIANSIQYIKHCKQNTLYIKHCKQNTLY